MRHPSLALIVLMSLGIACATTSSTSSTTSSPSADSVKSQKDRTACLKMCEMAGAAEDKADEVAACQAQCPAGAAADADTGATAP